MKLFKYVGWSFFIKCTCPKTHFLMAQCIFSDAEIPYAIILGGTDVNEMSRDREKLIVMTDVLKKARYMGVYLAFLP